MKRLLSVLAPFALVGTVCADFVTGFEPAAYSGSGVGVMLNGQQGWYNPVTGSIEPNVFTYAGNAPGFVSNPGGGSQFASGTATTT